VCSAISPSIKAFYSPSRKTGFSRRFPPVYALVKNDGLDKPAMNSNPFAKTFILNKLQQFDLQQFTIQKNQALFRWSLKKIKSSNPIQMT
jgi:hypothetical protein